MTSSSLLAWRDELKRPQSRHRKLKEVNRVNWLHLLSHWQDCNPRRLPGGLLKTRKVCESINPPPKEKRLRDIMLERKTEMRKKIRLPSKEVIKDREKHWDVCMHLPLPGRTLVPHYDSLLDYENVQLLNSSSKLRHILQVHSEFVSHSIEVEPR